MCKTYLKDQVPIKMFYKNPDDPKSRVYKSCFDCRIYDQKRKKIALEKKLKTSEPIKEGFSICVSTNHEQYSEILRTKVPNEMFLKNPEDPKSKKYKFCSDCRNYFTEEKK